MPPPRELEDDELDVELQKVVARAKSRLSDMVINEVSLVDQAANLRKFVLLKSKDGGDPIAKAAERARWASVLLKHGASVRPAERAILKALASGEL